MPDDPLLPSISNKKCAAHPASLNTAIEQFLGLGLPYSSWPEEVEKRGHAWYPGLKKVIIQKEYEFFRDEIQWLRSQPKIVQPSGSESNSLKSILEKLQGKPWMDGQPDEWEERLRTRRLLSIDAKHRSLINYVNKWGREAAKLLTETVVESTASGLNLGETENQPSIPTRCPPCFSSSPYGKGADHNIPYQDASGQAKRLAHSTHDTAMDTIGTTSFGHHSSQNANTVRSPYLHFDQSLPSDFTLFPTLQDAAITEEMNTSGAFHLPENPLSILQPSLVFNHEREAALASFEDVQFGDDDVPFRPGNLNEGRNIPEPVSKVFDFLEKDPILEESPEPPEAVFLDTPPPTFWQDHLAGATSINPMAIEDDCRLPDDTVTQDTSGPHFSLQNSTLDPSSKSTSMPESICNTRKRRRRNTFGVPPDMSACHVMVDGSSTSVPSPKEDTPMADCHGRALSSDDWVFNEEWKAPPPSRPLPKIPQTIVTPETIHAFKQTQIRLDQELAQARHDLESLTKIHQDALEYWSKEHLAMGTEVHNLREEVQRLRLLNKRTSQQYDGMTQELISEKIIHEATLRKKSVSDVSLFSTAEDREHGSKTFRSFPSSKNTRPLSLSLRIVTSINGAATTQNSSPTSSENTNIQRLPIPVATGHSSRSRSAESLPFRPARTSNGASSSCTSPISLDNFLPGWTPSTPIVRASRSGSAGSIAAPSVSNSTGRDPSSFKQLMRKISDGFMRKSQSSQVPPVPTLPTSTFPPPRLRGTSDTHSDSDKRLTNDSGYASLEFETTSEGCE